MNKHMKNWIQGMLCLLCAGDAYPVLAAQAQDPLNFIHLVAEKEVSLGVNARGTNYSFQAELHCAALDIEKISLSINQAVRADWVAAMGAYGWTNGVGLFSEVSDQVWEYQVSFAHPTNVSTAVNGDWSISVIRSGGITNTMHFTFALPSDEQQASDIFLAMPEIATPLPFSATNTTPTLTWSCADAANATYCSVGVEQRTCVTNELGYWWFEYGTEQESFFEDTSVTSWTPDALQNGTWEIWLDYISIPPAEMAQQIISNWSISGPDFWRASPYAPQAWPTNGLPLLASVTTKASEFYVGELAGQVSTPVMNPVSGTAIPDAGLQVWMYTTQPGAAIRYTLDGSEPTIDSAAFRMPFYVYDTTVVKAKAFMSGMMPSEIQTITLVKTTYTLDDALNAPYLTFTTSAEAPWFAQTTTTFSTEPAAAQSGAIGHRQSSWLETTVNGAGLFSFWWKTSCEDDIYDEWDYVSVSVDGQEQARLDGESSWQSVVLQLAEGVHTIRWEYVKDRVVSEGQDCAWVDFVTWRPAQNATSTTPVPVPYDWLNAYALVVTNDYETAAVLDSDHDGALAWQEYVAGTSPTDSNSVFRAYISLVEGEPYITWTPDLGTNRLYSVEGKAYLSQTWSATNAATRFFRVRVQFPPRAQ